MGVVGFVVAVSGALSGLLLAMAGAVWGAWLWWGAHRARMTMEEWEATVWCVGCEKRFRPGAAGLEKTP